VGGGLGAVAFSVGGPPKRGKRRSFIKSGTPARYECSVDRDCPLTSPPIAQPQATLDASRQTYTQQKCLTNCHARCRPCQTRCTRGSKSPRPSANYFRRSCARPTSIRASRAYLLAIRKAGSGPRTAAANSLADWFRHTSDPEWAEAQNIQDLVEHHPRAAIISGSVGLAIPFVLAVAIALPELLGAGAAEGPAATLALAQRIANVERYPMRFKRTIALLKTAEGPTLVAGGGTDLSPAQIAMARQLGLTPVTGVGEHAELTAISGARSLGLTPTAGVTTIHICPSCAVKIYNMGGWLTVVRHFVFGP
jgi:hypothetical protein